MNTAIFSLCFIDPTIPDSVVPAEMCRGSVTFVARRTLTSNSSMTFSTDLKERVVSLYSSGGVFVREVAKLLNVSLGFVHNVVSCHRRLGRASDPRPRFCGRHRVPDSDDLSFIREVVNARSSIYLDELQYKLATISRTLSRMEGLSWEVNECNEDVRLLWELDVAQYTDPEMLVFLDESAMDSHTLRRASSWSAAGTPAVERSTLVRDVCDSILPALTCQGMLALEIFEGSVNKERFIRILRENIVCPSFACAGHAQY